MTIAKTNSIPSKTGTPVALKPVRFEFSDPSASEVLIAGSFNGWEPDSKELYSSGDGRFWKETSLAPGRYEYCLVVDGRWMADPLAKESVPNPYGGRNSILNVDESIDSSHLANAETAPMAQTIAVKKA